MSEITFIGILIGDIILITLIFLFMFRFYSNRMSESQAELLNVILSTKNHYTLSHQAHVAALADVFYDHLPKEYKRQIKKRDLIRLGKIHDIGKCLTPDNILNKSDKLTDEEFEIIKAHAAVGAGIADKTCFKNISSGVLCHHEFWDGKGYYGIAGESIPLYSRIISICDVASALVNDRPYKKGISMNEAMEIIKHGAGTQFDKELAEIFCSIDVAKLVAVDSLLKKQYIV